MLAGWGRFVHRFRFAVIALSLASLAPSLWLIAHGGRLAPTDVPTTTESGRALDLIGRELPGRPPSFSFIFSARPGTPAATLPDETPQEVKLARLQRLQARLEENVRTISAARVGTVQRILVEGPSRRNAEELMGRTECNRIVNFEGAARLVGQMIDVRITKAYPHSLRAELLLREDALA